MTAFCHYICCQDKQRWLLKDFSNYEPRFAWTLDEKEAIRFYRVMEATAVMQVIAHEVSNANLKLLEVQAGRH